MNEIGVCRVCGWWSRLVEPGLCIWCEIPRLRARMAELERLLESSDDECQALTAERDEARLRVDE